jgi:hypothetical protein
MAGGFFWRMEREAALLSEMFCCYKARSDFNKNCLTSRSQKNLQKFTNPWECPLMRTIATDRRIGYS